MEVEASGEVEAEVRQESVEQDEGIVEESAASEHPAYIFEGAKVLAHHGPLLYLAKVLNHDKESGKALLHYDGWKRKWDEWVGYGRIVEDNEENRKLRDQLKSEYSTKSAKAAEKRNSQMSSSSSKRKKSLGATDTRDNDHDQGQEQDEDDVFGDPAVRLNLSDDLKHYIIHDWENITQKGMFVELPKSEDRTVSQILADFVATKKKLNIMQQICEGLSVYFDRALPTILLYRAEREQYEQLKASHEGKRMCELYGCEHLLRLFVRLPQLLGSTDLDDSETKQLSSRLQEFIRFLTKNATTYLGGSESDAAYIQAPSKEDDKNE